MLLWLKDLIKKGIGKRLIQTALSDMQKRGCKEVDSNQYGMQKTFIKKSDLK